MFMIEIAGMRLLYTGDYSRIPDRHLSAADLPETLPDIGGHGCLDPHNNNLQMSSSLYLRNLIKQAHYAHVDISLQQKPAHAEEVT